MHAKRLTRDQWRRIVTDFAEAGLTQEAFAQAHGVSLASFRGWLYRLRRESKSGSPRFVEVVSENGAVISTPNMAVIVGCMRVEFHVLPSAEYLGVLARTLGATAT